MIRRQANLVKATKRPTERAIEYPASVSPEKRAAHRKMVLRFRAELAEIIGEDAATKSTGR